VPTGAEEAEAAGRQDKEAAAPWSPLRTGSSATRACPVDYCRAPGGPCRGVRRSARRVGAVPDDVAASKQEDPRARRGMTDAGELPA